MKSLSNIFKASSYIAMVGWIILIVLPNWKVGLSLVLAIVVFLLCLIYSYLIFFGKQYDGDDKVKGSFWSLRGVISLFKSPRVVLAGWIHYLAFDLMIGFYIVADAARFDIAHWMLIPCLIMTLLFGPVGLLLYFVLRFALVQEYAISVGL